MPPTPHPDFVTWPGVAQHRVAGVHLRGRAGPLRARVCWPARVGSGASPPLLVLFRAGGFFPGSVDGTARLCRGLCCRVGVVVLSASYRPALETPYPAAFSDATTAMEWAADHAAELDADPGRLLVAGEGAGGNLAAALALHARDHRWPTITRQVLIYPNLDASQDAPSDTRQADARTNSTARMRRYDELHLSDGTRRTDPYASPLRAPSVAGVAPATVVTVGHGPRCDDGRRYAARLRQAGVEVEELRYDSPAHGVRVVSDLACALRHTLEPRSPPTAPRSRDRPDSCHSDHERTTQREEQERDHQRCTTPRGAAGMGRAGGAGPPHPAAGP